MSLNRKTQSDIINDLGYNKSAVSTWCNGTRLPRMDKVDALAKYFGINRSDLIEEKNQHEQNLLSARDERDISRRLEKTLDDLENQQDALMFDGAPMDDQTRELLKASLENSIRIAKINAKKFTPKKYLHTNEKQGE
ncbi:MAG TPA: helix-turn-helix domain-containing protein [Candidatus Lachnoclostridium avicola]|nr:helix-turn-helix domain-containing protein [Candidatus Lachnoclostridium avicola]